MGISKYTRSRHFFSSRYSIRGLNRRTLRRKGAKSQQIPDHVASDSHSDNSGDRNTRADAYSDEQENMDITFDEAEPLTINDISDDISEDINDDINDESEPLTINDEEEFLTINDEAKCIS